MCYDPEHYFSKSIGECSTCADGWDWMGEEELTVFSSRHLSKVLRGCVEDVSYARSFERVVA